MTKPDLKLRADVAVESDQPRMIQGMLPWEFCCKWYKIEEIAWSISGKLERQGTFLQRPEDKIPTDVSSRDFAEWLTHQYRLAMNKGMQLAFDAALAARLAELKGG